MTKNSASVKSTDKKQVPVLASALLAVALVAAFCLTAYLIPKTCDKVSAYIARILDCLSYLVALFYCVTGYKKNSAKFFYIFCGTYLIGTLMTVFSRSQLDTTNIVCGIELFTSVITFGMLCVFLIGRNLGKNKSYTMSTLIVLCAVIDVFASLFLIPVVGMQYASQMILLLLGKLVLSIIFLFMIYAKYTDKDSRGTV